MAARRHVTNKLRTAYQKASKTDRGRILDEVVATTGMGRLTARRPLTGPQLPTPAGRWRPRPVVRDRANDRRDRIDEPGYDRPVPCPGPASDAGARDPHDHTRPGVAAQLDPPLQNRGHPGLLRKEVAVVSCVNHQPHRLVLELRGILPTTTCHPEHPLLEGVHQTGARPEEPLWVATRDLLIPTGVALKQSQGGPQCKSIPMI